MAAEALSVIPLLVDPLVLPETGAEPSPPHAESENPCHNVLQQLAPRFRDLVGMHFKLRGQLGQRLTVAQSGQGDRGLEFRIVGATGTAC